MKFNTVFLLVILFFLTNCSDKTQNAIVIPQYKAIPLNIKLPKIYPADMQTADYLHLLKDKRVALLANQTAVIGNEHLLDFLIRKGVNVVKIFAPEHGFRGKQDRGKHFDSQRDAKTGVLIEEMFGLNRKASPEQLQDVDIVIFDIQDVGVRFYTYISSMHIMMEACAETNTKFLVLDRPNPLGDYTDGAVLQESQKSFVGMHPIPIVHGLTVGELAKMINGESWLKNGLKCNLTVIKSKNYTHKRMWSLPVKPSPNLPNDISVRLYPSLCFFEATKVSIGRGTEFPFQVIGYPDSAFGNFCFTPKDMPGMQTNPVQENKICCGYDLRNQPEDVKFTLKYFIEFAGKFPRRKDMISNPRWFNLLAGNTQLYEQIISGKSEEEIRESWKSDLENYKAMRKKYLLYPDFE